MSNLNVNVNGHQICDHWEERCRTATNQQSTKHVDNAHSDNLEASFRSSPSGRRRSDNEVERLPRIKRNERTLSQLGLLIPLDLLRGGGGDDPAAKVTKRRRSRIRKNISTIFSLSTTTRVSKWFYSEPWIHPKRQGNSDELLLPLNSWTSSFTPPLRPRLILPIARPKQTQPQQPKQGASTKIALATTAPNGYLRTLDSPNWLGLSNRPKHRPRTLPPCTKSHYHQTQPPSNDTITWHYLKENQNSNEEQTKNCL